MFRMIASFAVFLFATILPSSSPALEINKNGFEIEVYHREKSDGLHVWGNVEEGRECKQLNLTVFFRNSESAEISRVVTAVKNYSGIRANFRGIDEVHKDGNRNKWFLDDVYTKCLN